MTHSGEMHVYRMLEATYADVTRRFYMCKNRKTKSRILRHLAQLNTAIENFWNDAYDLDATYE